MPIFCGQGYLHLVQCQSVFSADSKVLPSHKMSIFSADWVYWIYKLSRPYFVGGALPTNLDKHRVKQKFLTLQEHHKHYVICNMSHFIHIFHKIFVVNPFPENQDIWREFIHFWPMINKFAFPLTYLFLYS